MPETEPARNCALIPGKVPRWRASLLIWAILADSLGFVLCWTGYAAMKRQKSSTLDRQNQGKTWISSVSAVS
jgi:hypothetical protein